MPLPKSSEIVFWHRQFQRQAGWTEHLRYHLYRRVCLGRRKRILDLGCGTGVIAQEVFQRTGASVWGLDRDSVALNFALKQYGPEISWVLGRAEELPFAGGSFDLILTHFFWFWLGQPEKVVRECRRTLRPGGYVIALAEPDYSRRRDEPAALSAVYQLLTDDLRAKGADPFFGARLENIFRQAGLGTEAGSMAQVWGPEVHRTEFIPEWRMIERVLGKTRELARLKKKEKMALARGRRRSTMPLFWAVGRKRDYLVK